MKAAKRGRHLSHAPSCLSIIAAVTLKPTQALWMDAASVLQLSHDDFCPQFGQLKKQIAEVKAR